MTQMELLRRTKTYALRIIRLVRALPRDDVAGVLGRQLLRSGTSGGANHRAACRAKSAADFVHTLKIVEEEGDEIAAIIVASLKTLHAACANS